MKVIKGDSTRSRFFGSITFYALSPFLDVIFFNVLAVYSLVLSHLLLLSFLVIRFTAKLLEVGGKEVRRQKKEG